VFVILNAIAEKLKRRSTDVFKGRDFDAWPIIQAATRYLRYPLSYCGRVSTEQIYGVQSIICDKPSATTTRFQDSEDSIPAQPQAYSRTNANQTTGNN
jgi:hypothetical protein